MKKIVSALLSAALSVSAVVSVSSSAAEAKAAGNEKAGMVLLGDSIAAGVTKDGKVAHNYGEICGDYLGCEVFNYAESGDTTADLLKVIDGLEADKRQSVANAEYIVISVGGNDIMNYIAKGFIDFAVSKTDHHFINEEYINNIPEAPTLTSLKDILNINGEDGLRAYASSGIKAQLELNGVMGDIAGGLSKKNKTYEGYIETYIVPNIKEAADKLKAINPDARILVQTIYQPIQIDPAFVEKEFGKQSDYATILSTIRMHLENVMNSYSENISAVDGVEVVDVKAEFTSLNEVPSTNNPGHAGYFIDIQSASLNNLDVHPNQKGHLAIAAAVLDKIGKLHDDNGLLAQVYNGLSDKEKEAYPAIAYATYKKVAGDSSAAFTLGDINGDKRIDSVDASGILAEYALISSNSAGGTFTEAQKKAADVDKNGKIDSVDASRILAYYAYVSGTKENVKSFEEFLKTA